MARHHTCRDAQRRSAHAVLFRDDAATYGTTCLHHFESHGDCYSAIATRGAPSGGARARRGARRRARPRGALPAGAVDLQRDAARQRALRPRVRCHALRRRARRVRARARPRPAARARPHRGEQQEQEQEQEQEQKQKQEQEDSPLSRIHQRCRRRLRRQLRRQLRHQLRRHRRPFAVVVAVGRAVVVGRRSSLSSSPSCRLVFLQNASRVRSRLSTPPPTHSLSPATARDRRAWRDAERRPARTRRARARGIRGPALAAVTLVVVRS